MTQTPVTPVLPAAPDAPPAPRACVFALAGARFAVDVRSAREVVVFDEITVVPRAPRHLVGVANLRGTVMPIVDVRELLGLPESRPGRTLRTLVVRDGAVQAALVVDTVLGLEPFEVVVPADSPTAAGMWGPRPFMAGWIQWAGETLPLLDVPKILAALRPETPAIAQEAVA
ncbi:MAG: chemotaxis protein CheW [Candidatus Rokuibacteriota bacterium]|jgi:purine-binding chemotaxis protein CheW